MTIDLPACLTSRLSGAVADMHRVRRILPVLSLYLIMTPRANAIA
jgi:hypothetical protein